MARCLVGSTLDGRKNEPCMRSMFICFFYKLGFFQHQPLTSPSADSDHSDKHMGKLPINPPDGKHSGSNDEIDPAARQRRKRLKNLFASLNAMLPHVPKQADKVAVVDETLNYVRVLEQTLKELEKKKMERLLQSSVVSNNVGTSSREAFVAEQVASCPSSPQNYNNPVGFRTWTSVNLVVNVCGQDAQFSVCSFKNCITTICCVLDKYKIQVVSAHISSDNDRRFYMFQAHLPGASSAEETFKKAAQEIIQYLYS